MQLRLRAKEVARKHVAEEWQVCRIVPTADHSERLHCRDNRSVYAACTTVVCFTLSRNKEHTIAVLGQGKWRLPGGG